MCGIVGYVGPRQASPILVEGLRRMEYRGYDSAGVAVINGKGLEDFLDLGSFHTILLPHYLSDYEFTLRASRRGYRLTTDASVRLVKNEQVRPRKHQHGECDSSALAAREGLRPTLHFVPGKAKAPARRRTTN